jgi:branched-chain amino acid transport system substrate-binding protein
VIAPLFPIAMERNLLLMGLFGMANNEKFAYKNYFQIMPSGPQPALGWSQGFFEVAAKQSPKPQTIALVGADAEYPHNALAGAREHVKHYGLKVVYDGKYPPSTVDYTPIIRAIKATNPDLVYVASYPPDTAGIIQAAQEVGLPAKMFGGGMVGLQFAALQTKLGSKLNGVVNYEFYVPEPTVKIAGINEFLGRYQIEAEKAGVDPLGHYIPPFAYAYVQILGQAVEATKSLDQKKVAEYIQTHEFNTMVGPVKFAPNGEWAKSRVLMVQFQNVQGSDVAQFKKAGTRVVLYPEEWKSGTLIYPYSKAQK